MKINLTDLPILSGEYTSQEGMLTNLTYDALTNMLKGKAQEEIFTSFLLNTRESASTIEKIIEKEFLLLDSFSYESGVELGNFSKTFILHNLYLATMGRTIKINDIVVFHSLANISEQPILNYFNEELAILRNMTIKHASQYFELHKAVAETDDNFELVRSNINALYALTTSLKKITNENMTKTAMSFLGQKTIEQQFAFFARFIQERFGENWVDGFFPHQKQGAILIGKKEREPYIDVEDLEGIEEECKASKEEVPREDFSIFAKNLSERVEQQVKDSLSNVMQAVQASMGSVVKLEEKVNGLSSTPKAQDNSQEIEISEIVKEQSQIKDALTEIKFSLKEMTDLFTNTYEENQKLNGRINSFLDGQKRVAVLLKERHNIDL